MTEDINTDTGVVLEALNDKADRDLNNVDISLDTFATYLSADYDRAETIPVGNYTPPPNRIHYLD